MPELVTSRHGLSLGICGKPAEQSEERSDETAIANETVSTVHQLESAEKMIAARRRRAADHVQSLDGGPSKRGRICTWFDPISGEVRVHR